MSKVKSFLKRHSKKLVAVASASMIAAVSVISSFAAESGTPVSSSDMQSSFSTAISSIQSDVMGYIMLAIPVGLAIFGAIVAIKKGISFVRSLIGR